MSTPASSGRAPPLAALGAVGGVLLLVVALLQWFAAGTERTANLYPMQGEGWLRVLVPTLWRASDDSLLLLSGPSTSREDFRVELFARAFPMHRVRQGGISLGTLGDVMAELEYIEREYGRAAMPAILVMGVSPRFLAEIPDVRPLKGGLARYSPRLYFPDSQPAGFGLREKTWLKGTADHAMFLVGKQGSRYRTALWYRAARAVGPERSERFTTSKVANLLNATGLTRLLGIDPLIDPGIWHAGMEGTMPYRYDRQQPLSREDIGARLDDPESWWRAVYQWDVARDSSALAARVSQLLDFLRERHIELYVVHLPEHSLSRGRYRPDLARRYPEVTGRLFAGYPQLDLRCAVGDSAFYDAEHLLGPAARQVSERVIAFIKEIHQRLPPADPAAGPGGCGRG